MPRSHKLRTARRRRALPRSQKRSGVPVSTRGGASATSRSCFRQLARAEGEWGSSAAKAEMPRRRERRGRLDNASNRKFRARRGVDGGEEGRRPPAMCRRLGDRSNEQKPGNKQMAKSKKQAAPGALGLAEDAGAVSQQAKGARIRPFPPGTPLKGLRICESLPIEVPRRRRRRALTVSVSYCTGITSGAASGPGSVPKVNL